MTTQIAGRVRWTAEHRFYAGMALAMFATVYVGFARSFFLRPWFPEHPSPSETVFYVHGAFFTAWCLLLILQPSLAALGRIDVHRKLGAFGAGLAAVMVLLGLFGSLVAAGRPGGFLDVPVPPFAFLAVPFFDMLLFGVFVWLAITKRHDAQAHKRLMLLATMNLLGAGIARWPIPGLLAAGPLAFWAVADLFIVALAIWDFRSRGRLHPATVWGGLAIILSQPLRLALSGTPAWLAFAGWAVDLVR